MTMAGLDSNLNVAMLARAADIFRLLDHIAGLEKELAETVRERNVADLRIEGLIQAGAELNKVLESSRPQHTISCEGGCDAGCWHTQRFEAQEIWWDEVMNIRETKD